MSENAKLTEEMKREDDMFSSYGEHQACLDERVCNLEVLQSIWQSRNYVFAGPKGPPMKNICNFAHALFPETPRKQQLISLFDILYDEKKFFRNHIKTKMKPVLIP
jgi:hypothetical protein